MSTAQISLGRVVAPRGSSARQALISLNELILLNNNRCWANPLVAVGTTTSKVKTTNSVSFSVDGALYTKAATDDFWTLSGSVLAVSSFRVILLLVNAAGTMSIASSSDSLVSAAKCVLPDITTTLDGKAIFGYITVATNSSTTFTPGTTLLGAAGITTTYFSGVPTGFGPTGAPGYLGVIADGVTTVTAQ